MLKKSVWVMLAHEDEMLLLKRGPKANNPGLWNFPGGGTEEGETGKQTAARETFEEAGIKIATNKLKHIITIEDKGRLMAFYKCEVATKPTVTIDGHEISSYKWASLADMPKDKKLHFQTRSFIKHSRETTGIGEE